MPVTGVASPHTSLVTTGKMEGNFLKGMKMKRPKKHIWADYY
jgi:hypothetical protein